MEEEDINNIVEMGYDSGEDPTMYAKEKSYEDKLKSDKSMYGLVRFNIYRVWVFLNHFQNPAIFFLSLTVGSIAQLLFLETSDNISQGILFGWIAAVATYLACLILWTSCWLCGSDNKTLPTESWYNVLFFLTIVILLAITITSMVNITKNCFDEDGNYRKPKMNSEEEFTIYCDIKSFF